jgi:hypothetical protein
MDFIAEDACLWRLSEKETWVTPIAHEIDFPRPLVFSTLNFSDKSGSGLTLTLPALVAKWQTRTLEVRVG